MDKLKAAIVLLAQEKALPASYNDHPLKGDWKGYRDLHLQQAGQRPALALLNIIRRKGIEVLL
jgi:addiction module RelE/StbE family toxin